MNTLNNFRVILHEQIRPEDSVWSYNVPNLPEPHHTTPLNLIKSISVVASSSKQHITLRLQNAPTNRAIRRDALEKYIILSFEDFQIHHQPILPNGRPRRGTKKETGEYVSKMLTNGITINGIQFNFYGHDNSQLKYRSCYMYAGSKMEISRMIECMGDFSTLKSVGKKAKRIGLLFSNSKIGIDLPASECEDIKDIERNGYMFTDGCGFISEKLAKKLVKRQGIKFRDLRYLPSVFQIRYRGYKGVLTLDHTLKGTIQAQFRYSMRKLKDVKDISFSVINFSKPYQFGYLNDEITLLLHSLGISTEMLLQKQAFFMELLKAVIQGDPYASFIFLSYRNRLDIAEKLLIEGLGSVSQTIQDMVTKEYGIMLKRHGQQRCKFLIEKSRLLFGICDPTGKNGRPGKLREGECFLRVTLPGDGRAKTIINTQVLVTRNPCLHPGDLQKFTVVDVPQLSHLHDCIVFPTTGKRPSADLMSGGDLDGDRYYCVPTDGVFKTIVFVTWDSDIIPSLISQPALYPPVKEQQFLKRVITGDDRAEYFAKHTTILLGRVKNLYLKWARLKGPLSPECQQLNRLYAQCVDGSRIKIPEELQDPPEPPESDEVFVLDALHQASIQAIEASMEHHNLLPSSLDQIEIMDLILGRENIAYSEFELIQHTLKWCNGHKIDIMDFAACFNFSALTAEQHSWLLNQIPRSNEHESLVRNGLLQSQMLELAELRRFQLDNPMLHWKPIFSSQTDRMARFLNTACRALEHFHKKLIVFRPSDRITLMLYIPCKVPKASEFQVNDSIRVFALPRSKGATSPDYSVKPTKVNYRLFYDETIFQLYDLKKQNTWVFLNKGAIGDSLNRRRGDTIIRRQDNEGESCVYDCRVSVALNKNSKEIQTHVGRINREGIRDAEIYVISNRDTESMQFLDEWVNYIDTKETLPLFPKTNSEYLVPRLKDFNLDETSITVAEIIKTRDLSKLKNLDCIDAIREVLELLCQYDEKLFLCSVYKELLEIAAREELLLDPNHFILALVEFLPKAAYLIQALLESCIWQSQKASLAQNLATIAPELFRPLILSGNSLQHFIKKPLQLLVDELEQLSVQQLVSVVKLIALTIGSPELAADLLMECIQPQSCRLLLGELTVIDQFIKSIIGIALNYIYEINSTKKEVAGSLQLRFQETDDGFSVAQGSFRIDSPLSDILKKGEHVRLTASTPPNNLPLTDPCSMDAIVTMAENGVAKFQCLHQPPSYLENISWDLTHCGSSVDLEISLDAVTTFYTNKETSCPLYEELVGGGYSQQNKNRKDYVQLPFRHSSMLDEGQNRAVEAAMKNSLTFLWCPPGTGKIKTIITILKLWIKYLPNKRILVTAPTDKAVDNILLKFIEQRGLLESGAVPLRVSTSPSTVMDSLKRYTCHATMDQGLKFCTYARNRAQKRVKQSKLVFTPSVAAGLDLLREEQFALVLIDEASQHTEPETLIPLVKGCERAALFGDHVGLRPVVRKEAALLADFDISLFERHYGGRQKCPEFNHKSIGYVMLDTQYRMHRDICRFSSKAFYEEKLKTAVLDSLRSLPPSTFPWPLLSNKSSSGGTRKVFVQCSSPEELWNPFKANLGHVKCCQFICQLLNSPPATVGSTNISSANRKKSRPLTRIAILTPYVRQKELLVSALPGYNVSIIDDYQGCEADVVIFVTVRSNVHGKMGFLNDMRQLNVVMTCAKAGIIIIGDRTSLTVTHQEDSDDSVDDFIDMKSRKIWKKLLDECTEIHLPQMQ